MRKYFIPHQRSKKSWNKIQNRKDENLYLRRGVKYQLLFDNLIPPSNFSLPGDHPQLRGIEILNVPLGSTKQVKEENV